MILPVVCFIKGKEDMYEKHSYVYVSASRRKDPGMAQHVLRKTLTAMRRWAKDELPPEKQFDIKYVHVWSGTSCAATHAHIHIHSL